jgi:hypothetical protein
MDAKPNSHKTAPEKRGDFLQAVADTLATCPVIGDGAVHRAIVSAQRTYFDPPSGSSPPGAEAAELSNAHLLARP